MIAFKNYMRMDTEFLVSHSSFSNPHRREVYAEFLRHLSGPTSWPGRRAALWCVKQAGDEIIGVYLSCLKRRKVYTKCTRVKRLFFHLKVMISVGSL